MISLPNHPTSSTPAKLERNNARRILHRFSNLRHRRPHRSPSTYLGHHLQHRRDWYLPPRKGSGLMPSSWKARSPSRYPAYYATSVEMALAESREVLLSTHDNAYAARKAADKFREWRFCLRSKYGSPLHRCYDIELSSKIVLRTLRSEGLWWIYVSVIPPISETLDLSGLGISVPACQ